MPSLNLFLVLAAAFALAPLNGVVAGPLNNLTPRGAKPGINCDGSSNCLAHSGDIYAVLRKVNKIALGTTFNSGDKLACAGSNTFSDGLGSDILYQGGICAMVGHNTATFTVSASTNGQTNSAGDIVGDLIYHGCQACGTAPINRVGNNLADGSISVNAVGDVCPSPNDEPCPKPRVY